MSGIPIKIIMKTESSILYILSDSTIIYESIFFKKDAVIQRQRIQLFENAVTFSVEYIDTLTNKWDIRVTRFVRVDEKTVNALREKLRTVNSVSEFEEFEKIIANIVLETEKRIQRFYECLRASC